MTECTNSICEAHATRVMAWPMSDRTVQFVAPYCDEHAKDVAQHQGAVYACGPALSDDAREIEGIRR